MARNRGRWPPGASANDGHAANRQLRHDKNADRSMRCTTRPPPRYPARSRGAVPASLAQAARLWHRLL